MKTEHKLQSDVLAELDWEPSVNAAHIGVNVDKSVVTLSGHVNTFAEKQAAITATQRVAGVGEVVVNLTVDSQFDPRRTDQDIAAAVHNALIWNTDITTGSLKVNVEKGVVTLKGELLWTYQRDKVNKVVGALNGVKGVISYITVKSAVADSEVLNGIKQALTRRAAIDANRINVKVNGSVVTLEGSYSTWPEHDIVIDAAARTRGVTSVKDELSYRL